MPKAICPLISRIDSVGTLVTFQSTNDDLSYAFGNTSKGMSFSYFALLNIPEIIPEVGGANVIQFENIEGAYGAGLSVATPFPANERFNLAESMQNYLLNMESIIIRGVDYDPTTDLTVAERCFWKWLKEIGGIRYRAANGSEASAMAVNTFVEEDSSTYTNVYNRVVQYIGEIDMEGNQRTNTNSYKEVYMYVPTQNGGSPFVQFSSVSDVNYFAGMTIQQDGLTNIVYIQGQTGIPSVTTAGLRVLAFYDMAEPMGSFTYTMNSVSGAIWFSPMAGNGPYAYFTDVAFGDATNDVITRDNLSSTDLITYIRSRLDGVCIDFNLLDYQPMYLDTTITAFGDWNGRATSSSNFVFNAVLVYYDVYDLATPDKRTTNLYGVLFIDDLEIVGTTGAGIEGFLKTKPDVILGQSGNGYAIKMNLRFDAIGGSLNVDVSVNDYNTFSMLLYADAMANIANIASQMETVLANNRTLSTQIQQLQDVIINSTNAATIMQQIQSISNQLNSLVGTDVTAGIRGLITDLNKKVTDIINGKYPISLASTIGILPKDGLTVTQTGDQTYQIGDSKQAYNSTNQFTMYMGADQTLRKNTLTLKPRMNLYYHTNDYIELNAICNLNVYIDDTSIKWSNGQVIEIYLSDSINFGTSYGISIYTDSTGVGGGGVYGELVGVVPNPTPNSVIKIVCLDAINFDFLVIQVQ